MIRGLRRSPDTQCGWRQPERLRNDSPHARPVRQTVVKAHANNYTAPCACLSQSQVTTLIIIARTRK